MALSTLPQEFGPLYIARFWAKVDVGDENECWIWKGAKNPLGYGRLKFKGKNENAHRIAYLLLVGPIHDGNHVLHRCDVRACINPRHLFQGSHLENMLDCHKKGRLIGGAVNLIAKAKEALPCAS